MPGVPVGRIARNDAVEIGGIALHFGERLLATEGTALEIGMRRRRAVIGLDDPLLASAISCTPR